MMYESSDEGLKRRSVAGNLPSNEIGYMEAFWTGKITPVD